MAYNIEIRSKYQKKTLEEITNEPERVDCPMCTIPFFVYPQYIKTEVDEDEDWEIYRCPYCHCKFRVCL